MIWSLLPIQPPERERQRIETYFDPLPIWYPPFEGEAVETSEFPMHALTQRPMAMYHSWGSQNAWLRQIHGTNPLYMNRRTAKRLEIEDGDWVWVTSHHGRIKAKAKLMEGVNLDTVWTWNAIGVFGAFRPIRTAFTRAAPSICCKFFWAASIARAASATSRPSPRPHRRR